MDARHSRRGARLTDRPGAAGGGRRRIHRRGGHRLHRRANAPAAPGAGGGRRHRRGGAAGVSRWLKENYLSATPAASMYTHSASPETWIYATRNEFISPLDVACIL